MIRPRALCLTLSTLFALLVHTPAAAAVKVYGPGGPAPAMTEAATVFRAQTGIVVEVTSGPTSNWLSEAKQDADLIYSGSEHMMTDLIKALEPQVISETVQPLYLRPSAILVRKGNPKRIRGLRDLLRPNRKVIVVNGAGQVGLWEDLVGQFGDINSVRALRRNIVNFAGNSADAQKLWNERPDIDAWIVWNVWSSNGRTAAEVVPVEKDLRIYRDMGVAFTARGVSSQQARAFAGFLSSPAGKKIFARYGWIEKASPVAGE